MPRICGTYRLSKLTLSAKKYIRTSFTFGKSFDFYTVLSRRGVRRAKGA
jgi:hypothetical protein